MKGILTEPLIYSVGTQVVVQKETYHVNRRVAHPAELHWSLYGVPEQLENEETQEAYWELQKFIVLALKANPNVLECLYSIAPTMNESMRS